MPEHFTPPINTDARPGADERRLLDQLENLHREGEESKKHWFGINDAKDDLKLYRGENKPVNREPFFAANFIQAFIDRMVAQLTDNRPILRVEHRKIGFKNTAKVLEKVMHAVWQESDLQRQVFKMAHNAAVVRSSGIYTGYDSANDEIFFEVIRFPQVVFDPAVTEAGLLHKAEYVIIERVRPLSELQRRFPGRGGLVQADARFVGDPSSGGRTVHSPVTAPGSDSPLRSGDAIERARTWECIMRDRQTAPDGKVLFPTYRQIIYTKDVILSDRLLPFWDGQIPLDWFDWIVDPEHPWGHSEPARLKHLQLSFNQIMDGTIENQLLTNIITILADSDALTEKQWNAFQKIDSTLIVRKLNRNAAVTITPPPTFGADKIAIARTIFTYAQLLTGVTDVTLGESPGSLQSGQAIEGLQEGANLMTRARASRIEDFLARVGQKLISRILQFVTADRIFSMLGPTGGAVEYAFKRQELLTNDQTKEPLSDAEVRNIFRFMRFAVLPGSSAPGSRVARASLVFKLLQVGAADRKLLMEAADFSDPEQMIKDAEADVVVRNLIGAGGGPDQRKEKPGPGF